MKTIKHPFTEQTFKMGRNRPVARCPRLSLKNYLLRSFPHPPQYVNYTEPAQTSLSNIFGNDLLGDCVIAAMGHIFGTATANAGNPIVLTDQQIIDLYSAIGGYVPGNPSTDNGCDEQTALNYWRNNGLFNGLHKITGWMAVNPADPWECRVAIYLFENLFYGMELPDDWINPMPSTSGFIWGETSEAPDPNNGHAVCAVGYDAHKYIIDTWGMLGNITNDATEKYAASSAGGELYCVLTPDMINKAIEKAPNGFDWSQLLADFQALT